MRRMLIRLAGLLVVMWSSVFAATARAEQAQAKDQEAFTALTVSPLARSTAPVFGTDGAYHVVYELEILNTRRVPATLKQIDILDGANRSRVLKSLSGGELLDNLGNLSAGPVADTNIEPNGGRLLAIEVLFASNKDIPRFLVHRITAQAAENPGAQAPTEVRYLAAPFELRGAKPPVLGPPVKGSRWVAVNGCCRVGFPHRFSVLAVNGVLFNPQRFAIDWVRLDENGFFVSGDPKVVSNWGGYGVEVLAVADGTVVDVLNNLPDQTPCALPDPTTLTLRTVEGNHVILDFGNGTFGFYAHLQNGSIRVDVGDKVKRGEVLGLLGNSGNTSAPHLHFHLSDGPAALASDGLPYVHSGFAFAGQVDRRAFLDASSCLEEPFGKGRIATPEPRRNEYPLQLNIIDFPQ